MDGAIIIILSIFDFREIDMRRVTQGKQQSSMHALCIIHRSLFSSPPACNVSTHAQVHANKLLVSINDQERFEGSRNT